MNTNQIFEIDCEKDFNKICLEVFEFQYANCSVYRQYVDLVMPDPKQINGVQDIPFLPIEFFKSQLIISKDQSAEIIFTSSGTTGQRTSRHLVADVSIYQKSFRQSFNLFYGDVKKYAILALLPSYSERNGSSLIYMVDDLIRESQQSESNYFLYNHDDLYKTLLDLQKRNKPTILIGVTYALLDFVEQFQLNFENLIVMETGGMKGKRKELVRDELHEILKSGFGVPAIHSEYGMTEMLSQGYSKANGRFQLPPWCRILIRDTNDPLSLINQQRNGAINVVDLANIYSCSFIATQDLGRINPEDQSFEILGRFDQSDIRGCNLLVQ